ncbi:cation:H+ antiporter [Thermosipho japonicus]|uniref:Cation:H+ antiporter n=1 Tax=Thermosipho japonicus TaxID=90323 RepID=A0A841GKT3_9BACT|nr:calcium/sodium antiporter [Thermosipho japonicus]MBB6063007.1 cation:H+ antiporter [Thermosipho japonicus]
MFWAFLGLIIGIILLIKGADWLVDGAVSVALNLGVSKMVVGLSVVAFGTSLPELVASLVAVFKGYSSVSISNVVGSNIANISLALALSALFVSIPIKDQTIRAEMPFMLISTFTFTALFLKDYNLVWNYGIVFLLLMIIYIYYLITSAKEIVKEEFEEEVKEVKSTWLSIFLSVLGVVGVSVGGEMTIKNVVKIAEFFNLSETFVGLTIVAIGTSLPEIVVSIISTVKGESDILVGNIVGSNVFNILLILGVSSLFGNLVVDVNNFTIDLIVMNLMAVLLFVFSIFRKRIFRFEAIVFLSTYFYYLYQIILRR